MKKRDNLSELPSLADEDIVTVSRTNAQRVIRSGKNLTVSLALIATGTVLLPSCSDDKTCSDSDTGSQAPYNTGTYADPTDYGQTTGYGDAIGNGDRCTDYD